TVALALTWQGSPVAFSIMTSRLARARALIDRYRADRRLPPPVGQLIRDLIVLRVKSALHLVASRVRRPLGTASGTTAALRLGARRVAVAGPLTSSIHELSHQTASRIVDVLANAGVDTRLVGRNDNS